MMVPIVGVRFSFIPSLSMPGMNRMNDKWIMVYEEIQPFLKNGKSHFVEENGSTVEMQFSRIFTEWSAYHVREHPTVTAMGLHI